MTVLTDVLTYLMKVLVVVGISRAVMSKRSEDPDRNVGAVMQSCSPSYKVHSIVLERTWFYNSKKIIVF
ncbi:MAG: hypothetical protein HPY62_03210 [Bacteroidales bacterium]|nr:hypothetical protein [Bacteroidales bacterium]